MLINARVHVYVARVHDALVSMWTYLTLHVTNVGDHGTIKVFGKRILANWKCHVEYYQQH